MASLTPEAKYIEIDTTDHLPFFDRSDEFMHHIQVLLTGSSTPAAAESRVSTLMFTDIVGSTEMAVEKGDLRFADLLQVHHAAVRGELARYRGDRPTVREER